MKLIANLEKGQTMVHAGGATRGGGALGTYGNIWRDLRFLASVCTADDMAVQVVVAGGEDGWQSRSEQKK